MQPSRGLSDEPWFAVVWLIASAWLIACALMVGGEYGDGYQTMANAKFFYADNPDIYAQRGPLAALLLWPVEALVTARGLNPVDVRPYHFYSGLLHSAYLLGCWLLLRHSGETFAVRIIAFVVAILSVVFYANAPFLSHDIVPGFLFLLLIFLCDRWLRSSSVAYALLIVLIATAAALIKQTFAIFFVSLCVYVVLASLFKWHRSRVSLSTASLLLALAVFSAILTWIAYGWFLGAEIPSVALLQRPLLLVSSVSNQYDIGADSSMFFPWDLYLRNLHNFGITTVLLLIPGVFLALRGDNPRQRMIAVCWLFSVIVMQVTSFREVRYLAFLAPLTAMLIAPVIGKVFKSRALLLPLIVLFAFDQYRGLTMAASQLTSTVGMNVTRFVGEPVSGGRLVASTHLSFAYMADSPILHDRYHGIFHLTAEHLRRLYQNGVVVQRLEDPRDLGQAGVLPGDRVLYANRTLVRRPPWETGNRPNKLHEFIQTAGTVATIELLDRGDHYSIVGHDGRYVMLVPDTKSGKAMPLIASGQLPAADIEAAYGDGTGATQKVPGVVLDALCQADRCSYFD